MKIASGVTDQYIYFIALDSTDFQTRETGFSSFTVYRSRNGAAAAAMTTPTINETDSANMPGVYELLLDEDMTIGAGNLTEEMVFHITHAGMAPVSTTIELYSVTDVLQVIPLIPNSVDEVFGASTFRFGLMLINAVGDLPTTAEITPGTINIAYKELGDDTWTTVVNDAACSESDGMIYYDESFNDALGYSEGDSIRIIFKSQKITVNSIDHVISDSTGLYFYTYIRQESGGSTASTIADAVWDELSTGHTSAGKAGEQLWTDVNAILADTNELQADDTPAAIAALPASVADQVWEETLADHSGTSGSTAEALSQIPGAAKGAVEYTYTIDDGTNPIDGAEVWITTDSGGNNVIWSGTSDALGVARASDNEKPWLDAGTYYGWAQKSGYSFSNPDTLTVS